MKFQLHVFVLATVVITECRHLEASHWTSNRSRKALCANASVSDTKVKMFIAERLKKSYFRPKDRPIRNAMKAVTVNFAFYLHGISTVNEKEGCITVFGYLHLEWLNEFAIWNDTWPYLCIREISRRSRKVWVPDVALINSADDMFGIMKNSGFGVRMASNGVNLFCPGGEITFYCSLNLALFPFDQHNCSLLFEAWTYSSDTQRFTFGQEPLHFLRFQQNEQWHLVGTDTNLRDVPYENGELFHQAKITLILRRKSAYYSLNVILPSFIISLVGLVTFTFQEDDFVKVHISFTCLLSYSVFQVMVIGDMPRISQNLPVLSIYIVFQMTLIGFKILLEGVVYIFFSHYFRKKRFSEAVFKFVKMFGRLLFVSDHSTEEILIVRLEDPSSSCGCNFCSQQPRPRPSNIFDATSRRRNSDQLHHFPDSVSFLSTVDEAGRARIRSVDSGVFKPTRGPSIIVSRCSDDHDPSDVALSKMDSQRMSCKSAVSAVEACSAAESSRRWIYSAKVVDRFTFVFYFTGVVLAPFFMFIVLPLL